MRRRQSGAVKALAAMMLPAMGVNGSTAASSLTPTDQSSPRATPTFCTRMPATVPTTAVTVKAISRRTGPSSRSAAPSTSSAATTARASSRPGSTRNTAVIGDHQCRFSTTDS